MVYPEYVEKALEVINQQCPQADARVLCDYIEIADPHWQAAIEGYLGGARFSILVDESYEAEAIRIVRTLPSRYSRARIIQASKARKDASNFSLNPDSICSVMTFSHNSARDFLIASYGMVVRVDNEESLRSTRRGLTINGLASGNYSMFRCDINDRELVFGAGARTRALESPTQRFRYDKCPMESAPISVARE